MTAELRRRAIIDVYEITGFERAKSEAYGDVKPERVEVELEFNHDTGCWVVRWLTIKGPLFKHTGEVSMTWKSHPYSEWDWQKAPDFAQDLVRQSFAEATGVYECGCPVQVVTDEGHQEGCSVSQ